jgi:hypothetical protein
VIALRCDGCVCVVDEHIPSLFLNINVHPTYETEVCPAKLTSMVSSFPLLRVREYQSIKREEWRSQPENTVPSLAGAEARVTSILARVHIHIHETRGNASLDAILVYYP